MLVLRVLGPQSDRSFGSEIVSPLERALLAHAPRGEEQEGDDVRDIGRKVPAGVTSGCWHATPVTTSGPGSPNASRSMERRGSPPRRGSGTLAALGSCLRPASATSARGGLRRYVRPSHGMGQLDARHPAPQRTGLLATFLVDERRLGVVCPARSGARG